MKISIRLLKRNWLLLLAIGLFVVLAGKVALTRTFPLPYDEGFHLGLIQLYTHHLNPFLSTQPAGADALGAVARDPSYLYHYLMSFPLRLISIFVHSSLQQIIALRLLNIGLGVCTLLLFWKLCKKIGISAMSANIAVLALAVTPAFFDLSGQINYDNLLLPLTLGALLAVWHVASDIKRGQVPLAKLGFVLALLILTSLVKYSFLPIMAAMLLYLVITWARLHHTGGLREVRVQKAWPVAAAVLVVLLTGTLWMQRYGSDILTYGTPHPQCDAVLSVERCTNYGPWARNHELYLTAASRPEPGTQLIPFTKYWVRSMFWGVYSTVHARPGIVNFTPISSLYIAAKYIALGAVAYGLFRWRRLRETKLPWLLFGLTGFAYVVALWGQNFSDFHHLHAIVAVQGRYLLPLVPIVYALIAHCYSLLVAEADLIKFRNQIFAGISFSSAAITGTWRAARYAAHSLTVVAHKMPKFRTYP